MRTMYITYTFIFFFLLRKVCCAGLEESKAWDFGLENCACSFKPHDQKHLVCSGVHLLDAWFQLTFSLHIKARTSSLLTPPLPHYPNIWGSPQGFPAESAFQVNFPHGLKCSLKTSFPCLSLPSLQLEDSCCEGHHLRA